MEQYLGQFRVGLVKLVLPPGSSSSSSSQTDTSGTWLEVMKNIKWLLKNTKWLLKNIKWNNMFDFLFLKSQLSAPALTEFQCVKYSKNWRTVSWRFIIRKNFFYIPILTGLIFSNLEALKIRILFHLLLMKISVFINLIKQLSLTDSDWTKFWNRNPKKSYSLTYRAEKCPLVWT